MKPAMTVGSGTLAALLTILAASPAVAQDRRDTSLPIPTQDKRQTAVPAPVYKPPLRGAPGGRVGGGTRGVAARDVFVLSALAPDHMGLTASEQPSLYWFISSPTSLPVEIAIMDPQGVKPLVESRVAVPVEKGVHRTDLRELGVRLERGVAYRWSVTVIPDANRRSRDILAAATIQLVEMPDQLRTKLAQARKEDLPSLYAEAGLWYEALGAISELIERAPDDVALREQRAGLLTQVGLPDIGEASR